MPKSRDAVPVASANDLFGALVRTRGEPYQILEAEFGLTTEGELGFSRLKILKPDNEVVSGDSYDLFAFTFSDVSKLEGFWITVGSNELRLWVDEFSFQVDEKGYFDIVYNYGTSESGQIYLLDGECDWHTMQICGKAIGCTSCGEAPWCPCTSGSPKCKVGFVTVCSGLCESGTCQDFVIPNPLGGPPLVLCACL